MGAEATRIEQGVGLGDPAAVAQGLEVADVGSGLPRRPRLVDERVDAERLQPLGLRRGRRPA